MTGQQRLTFGIAQLADGIDVVVVAVGIFAVGEALWVAAHLRRKAAGVIPVGRPWMGRDDWGRSWKPWLRGTAFGFPFGALPAGGAEIPTFLSYMTERKLSKRPEEFGKGAIEGVAGPEAANNASAAGTLVPMLALGLPTNATAAIMLGGPAGLGPRARAAAHGEAAGPRLDPHREPLRRQHDAARCSTCRSRPPGPSCSRSRVPTSTPASSSSPRMGAYAVNAQPFDLFLLLGLGLVGFALRRFGLPVLPLIIGVILGPLAELQGRRSLQLSGGEISGLVGGPVAWVCFAIIAIVLLWPLVGQAARPRPRPRRRPGVRHDGRRPRPPP